MYSILILIFQYLFWKIRVYCVTREAVISGTYPWTPPFRVIFYVYMTKT